MSKTMQNLFVFIGPSEHAWETSLRGGNMILNRFCIDEDAAFELSAVNYLEIGYWNELGKETSFL